MFLSCLLPDRHVRSLRVFSALVRIVYLSNPAVSQTAYTSSSYSKICARDAVKFQTDHSRVILCFTPRATLISLLFLLSAHILANTSNLRILSASYVSISVDTGFMLDKSPPTQGGPLNSRYLMQPVYFQPRKRMFSSRKT